MILLAIDPGLTGGLALFRGPDPVASWPYKLGKHDRFLDLWETLELSVGCDRVTHMAWEEPVMQGNAGASINRQLGVIQLVAESHGLPFVSINPATLKKWATGSGKASKEDMATAIRTTFGLEPATDGEVDALCVGWWATQAVEWGP